MATFSSVTRQHVLQAIAEYDTRGEEEFLDVYGFEAAPAYTLTHEGHGYDSRALLGVAHRFATGRLATPDDFNGDLPGALAILRRRGFEVSEPVFAPRAVPPRTRTPGTRAVRGTSTRTTTTRSTAPREATAMICPTCSMTLPATGICDSCS